MAKTKSSPSMTRTGLLRMINFFGLSSDTGMDTVIATPPPSFTPAELDLIHSTSGEKSSVLNSLTSNLQATSETISKAISNNESFASMVPEVDKARAIFVSSVLSPMDMNGNVVSVSLENCDFLPEAVRKEIIDVLHELINNKLSIVPKLQPWIGDALYKTGATPVLVIPRSVTRYLAESPDTAGFPGLESFRGMSSVELKDQFDITYKGSLTIGTEQYFPLVDELVGEGIQHLTNQKVPTEVVERRITQDGMLSVLKGMLPTVDKHTRPYLDVSLDISRIHAGVESFAFLDTNKKTSLGSKKVAVSNLLRVGASKMLTLEPVDKTSSIFKLEDNDEPLMMRLPTSAVIPVIVPGSPETRLGAYIAIDERGTPLDSVAQTTLSESTVMRSEFLKELDTMGTTIFKDLSKPTRTKAATDIFNIMLQTTLDQSLQSIGSGSAQVSQNHRLATAIFMKALRKEKVSLIFVPIEFLAYFAYDYREDGTGKSLLENAAPLINLRTSCIVAKITAMLSSAVDKHRITYSLGENIDLPNVEQVNAMIAKMYVNKHMINFSPDPFDFMRNLYSSSVSVIPKNFSNMKEFDVATDVSTRNFSSMDDSMEEMLTRFITMLLRVPASAMDDVNEKDFSRSVATTNLLFSNDIRTTQIITCREVDIILRGYAKHSKSTRRKINHILNSLDDKLKFDEGVTRHDIINHILSNAKTALPKPNVNPDRARLTEISEQCRVIEEVINLYWSEDMVDSEDATIKNNFVMIRSILKHKAIENLLRTCGDSNFTVIPELIGVENSEVIELNQRVRNVMELLKLQREAMTPTDDKETPDNRY